MGFICPENQILYTYSLRCMSSTSMKAVWEYKLQSSGFSDFSVLFGLPNLLWQSWVLDGHWESSSDVATGSWKLGKEKKNKTLSIKWLLLPNSNWKILGLKLISGTWWLLYLKSIVDLNKRKLLKSVLIYCWESYMHPFLLFLYVLIAS